jgi:hypothetical protein
MKKKVMRFVATTNRQLTLANVIEQLKANELLDSHQRSTKSTECRVESKVGLQFSIRGMIKINKHTYMHLFPGVSGMTNAHRVKTDRTMTPKNFEPLTPSVISVANEVTTRRFREKRKRKAKIQEVKVAKVKLVNEDRFKYIDSIGAGATLKL